MIKNAVKYASPLSQGDADVIAKRLRDSGDIAERDRLVSDCKKRGLLLPAAFSDDVARSRRASGESATFSATGDAGTPAPMTRERANILASFSDGRALLEKLGLKGDDDEPSGDPGQSPAAARAAADVSLSHTEPGRAILKRRGYDSLTIERMQRPGYVTR